LPGLTEEIEELEQRMNQNDFWLDAENATKILKESKTLKEKVGRFKHICSEYEDIHILIDLGIEEEDESIIKEVQKAYDELTVDIESMRIETLLTGTYDSNNAYLSIHAGAGGSDAQDWAEMLLRMFVKWADKKGYAVTVLDIQKDTEAGIKSVTIMVEGENAYGYLKSEKGVHRIVRISPFDTAGKRHTSFASVDIMPEVDADMSIEIKDEDIRIDTFRASGAGGQHVNKTDSAIRITHLPTGVVVQCQNERSQHSNKDTAMKMLISKLTELKELEHKERIEDIQGEYSQISFGSQIRSYVFHPYSMVKDHRTNVEIGNVQAVMDGDLDKFIFAYLKDANKI